MYVNNKKAVFKVEQFLESLVRRNSLQVLVTYYIPTSRYTPNMQRKYQFFFSYVDNSNFKVNPESNHNPTKSGLPMSVHVATCRAVGKN